MITLLGIVIVLGAVLAGFSMAGGHVHSLIHPSEIVTIGGAALGAMVASSPLKVLLDVVHGVIGIIKGGVATKAVYAEVMRLLYDLFRIARRDGLLAWDSIVENPNESPSFANAPLVRKDHVLMDFIISCMSVAEEGVRDKAEMENSLETLIRVVDEEHHAAVGALNRTADALPGFGIVAAVLGIVITMGAIDGPVEEIGHKVGAALVGTFLGILLSYGVIGPVAGRMEAQGHATTSLLKMIASAFTMFAGGASPRAIIDKCRRSIGSDVRPSATELEAALKSAEGG